MESGLLSNREIATLVWLGALALLLILKARTETWVAIRAFAPVLKERVILIAGLLYIIWMGFSVALGARFGLWNSGLVKHTVIWALLAGIGLLLSVTDALHSEGFFRKSLFATFGASAFVEFFVNFQSFPLWIEIILQPVVLVASLSVAMSASKQELEVLKKPMEWILACIGIAALLRVVWTLATNWEELNTAKVLREMGLPIWMSASALVYVYLLAIYAGYEMIFKRIGWANSGRSSIRLKAAVISMSGPRLGSIRQISGPVSSQIARAETYSRARSTIREARARVTERNQAEVAATQRLINFADVEGTDGDGRQLDQREFKETQSALRYLSTCEMGNYNKKSGYKKDLLPMVEGGLSTYGLPEAHGIKLNTSANGNQWYAYRKTITGHIFGIGSSAPPSDQWFYEGKTKPGCFPREPEWSQWLSEPDWD